MKMITLLMMMFADTGTTSAPDVQLLDFTASYCQPCQQMVPILQRMESDKFPVRRIDITEEHELARRFQVDRVPTLVLMVEGKEVKRFVGLTDEAELRSEMNRAARRLSEARQERSAAATRRQPSESPAEENKTTAAPNTGGSRISIRDIFTGLLGGGATGSEFTYPTVRGQSPDSSPEPLQGLQAAAAATVRIRVAGTSIKQGAKVQEVGTGTIVYSATGQAIVLTCAHIFLDIAINGAAVEVEVFENGKVNPYRATLVGGDHNSDLALLKMQSSKILPAVRLTQLAPKAEKGQALVSFGCNSGADPTRLETTLVDINRYDGPANLECTTDPESGRSGGGLFNANGDLVGVCSCADRKSKEGLYMAHPAILDLVKRLKMQSILLEAPLDSGEDAAESFADLVQNQQSADSRVATLDEASSGAENSARIEPPAFDRSATQSRAASPMPLAAYPEASGLDDSGSLDAVAGNAGTPGPAEGFDRSGPEVVIVIDDKTPGSQKKVIVIPQASPWMIELLTGESPDGTPSSITTALRPAVPASKTRSLTASRSSRTTEIRTLAQ